MWFSVSQGEIDLASAPLLQARLEEAEATNAAIVVVDLTGVTFMDLIGVHLLAEHQHLAAERLRVTGAPPQIRRLARLVQNPAFLPID